MAAPCDESPLLIMMEYYHRPDGDVKKSSGRPRRGSLGEQPSLTFRKIIDSGSPWSRKLKNTPCSPRPPSAATFFQTYDASLSISQTLRRHPPGRSAQGAPNQFLKRRKFILTTFPAALVVDCSPQFPTSWSSVNSG